MHTIKYRMTGENLRPRRTKLEIPGWAGQPEPRVDGSHEYAWHCVPFSGSSRILVGKKPGCDVAMSHNFQWLSGVFKGLKTGHDFGHEKTA